MQVRSGSMAIEDSQYGYLPHKYVAFIFVLLFGINAILHIGQATYYRMLWLFPTACLCALGELIGWAGRLWGSFSPSLHDAFMMQVVSTVISPTPLIAVNFILLSWIVSALGPCYARLTPIRYTIVFISCDFLALLIQAVGGAMAATASTFSGSKMGANIMLAGIVVGFAAIVAYCCLGFEFLFRYHNDRPFRFGASGRGVLDARVETMIYALALSTLLLFIRSVYRIVELAGGWNGRVLHTEVYFNVLDGGMVVLALFTFNIAHPGRLLGSRRPRVPLDYEATREGMGNHKDGLGFKGEDA